MKQLPNQIITRSLQNPVVEDLKSKMVLIGGPRQVGKTTFAKSFISNEDQYLSWDDLSDRKLLKTHQIDPQKKMVVLDEIHKYVRWRTLLKGLYDKYQDRLQIIVTGSARLDFLRKGGDSLFGRYHYYRMHPFTLPEIKSQGVKDPVNRLLNFGGFPEPFLRGDVNYHRRWLRERAQRVVVQDLADIAQFKELGLVELLVDALPGRVGSPLSIESLREDLEVSPNTVKRWIELLELVYYSFRILPFGTPKIRAVKKAQKLYLWDWSEIKEPGPRFENMVACHLLKYCHFIEDTTGHKMELRYVRDFDLREVDFIVIKDRKPIFAVECKTGDRSPSSSLKYFQNRLKIEKLYQVHLGQKEYVDQNIHVLPFERLCEEAELV